MRDRCCWKGKWFCFRCQPPGRWGTRVSKPVPASQRGQRFACGGRGGQDKGGARRPLHPGRLCREHRGRACCPHVRESPAPRTPPPHPKPAPTTCPATQNWLTRGIPRSVCYRPFLHKVPKRPQKEGRKDSRHVPAQKGAPDTTKPQPRSVQKQAPPPPLVCDTVITGLWGQVGCGDRCGFRARAPLEWAPFLPGSAESKLCLGGLLASRVHCEIKNLSK